MARAFIDDLWLKNSADKRPPTSAMIRSLANAKDPMKARVPQEHRTARYGTGRRWRVRWYAEENGIKKARTRGFEKRSDAEEFQAALEDDIRSNRYMDPDAGKRPFRSVANAWLRTKLDVKEVTMARYERELRVYINPQWGDVLLSGITAKGVQEWIVGLMSGDYKAELPLDSHGTMRKPKPLAPKSIKNIVRVVMAGVLDYAVEQGYLRNNVLDRVTTPRVTRNEDITYLTIDEVEELAEQAGRYAAHPKTVDGKVAWPDSRLNTNALIIRFLAYTGCRIGEALSLQVADLDLDGRKARIRRTWTGDKDGRDVIGTPKNGKPRTIAMPQFLTDMLRDYTKDLDSGDFVFRGKHGGPLYPRTWRNRVFSYARSAAGMEDANITPHTLRHTYASIAIANGADVKTLQQQLGHATAAMTLDVYAALWPERLGEVADAVGDARAAALAETA